MVKTHETDTSITQLYRSIETIYIHREQCIHLRDRATILWNALGESLDKEPENYEMRKALDEMDHIVRRIHDCIYEWAAFGRVGGFLRQSDFSRELDVLERDLEMAGLRFSITTSMEVTRAQNLFKVSKEKDNAQLSELILSMATNRDDINTVIQLGCTEPGAVELIMRLVQK
ncbi:hypothetical protein FRC02_002099, partial [Tulasnella sp. 418]